MKRSFAILLALIFSLCAAFAQCIDAIKSVPPEGETLKYSAYFTMGAMWIKGGEAVFTSKPVGSYYHYTVKAYTLSRWHWIYDLNTSIEAYMNKSTLLPVSYASNTYEDKHWHREKMTYYSASRFKYKAWNDTDTVGREVMVSRPDCSYDLLNEVYASRNINLDAIPFGKELTFSVFFSDKMSEVKGQIVGKEKITLRNGKSYSCFKCKANSIAGTIFDASQPVYVWVTDDVRHIPVFVQCKIKVGYIKVYLESISSADN